MLGEERDENKGHFHAEGGIPPMKSGVKCPSWRNSQPPGGWHQEEEGRQGW